MAKKERLVLFGFDFGRPARNIWMLNELSIPFELVNDALPFARQYAHLNPNRRVPFLFDRKSDMKMFESLAINVWLAQHYKELADPATDNDTPSILPADAAEWGVFLKWSFWAMTELDMLLFESMMHNNNSGHILCRAANYEGYFDRPKTSERAQRLIRELEFPLSVLEGALKDSEWLMGDRFTVADLNVASVAYWVHFQGRDRREALLSKAPRVASWLDRCMERQWSPLSVLPNTSVTRWDWSVLSEGAEERRSRAGNVSFLSKL